MRIGHIPPSSLKEVYHQFIYLSCPITKNYLEYPPPSQIHTSSRKANYDRADCQVVMEAVQHFMLMSFRVVVAMHSAYMHDGI